MTTANLKLVKTDTNQPLGPTFAHARSVFADGLKALGIEDATDFATSIGYLVVGAYGISMVLNLALNY